MKKVGQNFHKKLYYSLERRWWELFFVSLSVYRPYCLIETGDIPTCAPWPCVPASLWRTEKSLNVALYGPFAPAIKNPNQNLPSWERKGEVWRTNIEKFLKKVGDNQKEICPSLWLSFYLFLSVCLSLSRDLPLFFFSLIVQNSGKFLTTF